MPSRGQNSLEYLLLIAGAILVAVVILLLLTINVIPVGGNFLGNSIWNYNNQFGGGGGSFLGPNLCGGGIGNGVVDDPLEQCDGLDLSSQTCQTQGFGTGVLLCTSSCSFDTSFCGSPGEAVTITRDVWGVANVFAPSDAGAFYGWGYASAEDRLYQMDWLRMTMRGRSAEILGAAGPSGSTHFSDLDRLRREHGYYRYESARVPLMSGYTQMALRAYADGVNQYIADHNATLSTDHPMFGARMPIPWEPADTLLAWDTIFTPGPDESEPVLLHDYENMGGDSNPSALAALNYDYFIDDDGATVNFSRDLSQGERDAMNAFAAAHPAKGGGVLLHGPPPKASHAWAVNGSRSTSGNSIFHGDPQLALQIPSILYEIHVQGATFNARGATVPGGIGFFVGFNSNVAWSATKAAGDSDDVVRLQNGPAPDTYVYKGSTYTMTTTPETVTVKNGSPISFDSKDTILGPVVTRYIDDGAGSVLPGEEYVWRSALYYDMTHHTIDAALDMMHAGNIHELRQAMSNWRYPVVNFIIADSLGNAGYQYGAGIPIRSSLAAMAGAMSFDSDKDWEGIIPVDILPHTETPADGAVYSANSLAIDSAYPVSFGAYGNGGGETFRSWRLHQLLRDAIEDNSALKFSPTDILAIHDDSQHSPKVAAVKTALLLQGMGYTFSPNAQLALPYLATWQANGSLGKSSEQIWPLVKQISIASFFDSSPTVVANYRPDDSGLVAWLKNVDSNFTTGKVPPVTPEEFSIFDNALADAWVQTNNLYCGGSPPCTPTEWSAKFNQTFGDGRFGIRYFDFATASGNSAAPANNRTFNGIEYANIDTIGSMKGQSYSQFIDFEDVEGARSLSPLGVSEVPGSLYYENQTPLWLAHSLHPAPLSQANVTPDSANPNAVTTIYTP